MTASLIDRLNKLPRQTLALTPTPLEAMPNLAKQLGPGELYVKRDDLTGMAFGGNKLRQLEYYFGEAVRDRADTILITGAVQSNFVRLAAASARKLGMDIHIQLEERVPNTDPIYQNSGNVLLDRLLGATLYSYPDGEDEAGADARIQEIAAGLKNQGRRPYIIPLSPGHPPKGALGYARAALEVLQQAAERKIVFSEVILPSGSGHTHAGFLFGMKASGSTIPVTGQCVRRAADLQRPRIHDHCAKIADLLGMENPVGEDDVRLNDTHLAPGYGQMSEAVMEALKTAARTEALVLDPVYSAKAMAGFIDRARRAKAGEQLVFLHTGGNPALFAYAEKLADKL
jgi:D-cysteine desulfhydrase/L-cysteate sulfo-lyase